METQDKGTVLASKAVETRKTKALSYLFAVHFLRAALLCAVHRLGSPAASPGRLGLLLVGRRLIHLRRVGLSVRRCLSFGRLVHRPLPRHLLPLHRSALLLRHLLRGGSLRLLRGHRLLLLQGVRLRPLVLLFPPTVRVGFLGALLIGSLCLRQCFGRVGRCLDGRSLLRKATQSRSARRRVWKHSNHKDR